MYCLSCVCQSIPGFRGYFTTLPKGFPVTHCISWDNPMYVKVSQDSADTLPKRSSVTAYPGIILCMSEYLRIPRILYQRGPCHFISWYVCQSIPGFRGYFTKGVPVTLISWDNPMYARISQDSVDTLPKGSPVTHCISWDNPTYVRVSQDSADTLPKGSPFTSYPGIILCMSEYPRIPQILYQRGPLSLTAYPGIILRMSEYPRIPRILYPMSLSMYCTVSPNILDWLHIMLTSQDNCRISLTFCSNTGLPCHLELRPSKNSKAAKEGNSRHLVKTYSFLLYASKNNVIVGFNYFLFQCFYNQLVFSYLNFTQDISF